jgi:heme exporter protein D
MTRNPVVRQQFTDEALSAFADKHISYEVSMVCHGVYMWQSAGAMLAPEASFCFIESILIHLRLLDDFLSRRARSTRMDQGERIEVDDVLALDYFPEWVSSSDLLSGRRRAINSYVAHVSMSRDEIDWDIPQLAQSVIEEFARFLSEIQRQRPIFAASFAKAAASVEGFLEWADFYGALPVGNVLQQADTFTATAPLSTTSAEVRTFSVRHPIRSS